jgi:hypothetical protein
MKCPTTEFSWHMIYPELVCHTTVLRAQFHRTTLTSDACFKHEVPRLLTLCPYLATKHRGGLPTLSDLESRTLLPIADLL